MPTNEAIERVERCPACHEPLVRVEDGRPDDNVHCGCTVVSLEWLRLAKPTPTPPADVVERIQRQLCAWRCSEVGEIPCFDAFCDAWRDKPCDVNCAQVAEHIAAIPAVGECPICATHSTFRGDPALSFCDEHFRQYLLTLQVRPKDLAAYRAQRIAALRNDRGDRDG